MSDRIFRAFLRKQYEEATLLARASDVLELRAFERPGDDVHDRYLVSFRCDGLIKTPQATIVKAHEFVVGMWLPPDYLVRVNPFSVLTWLAPQTVFHPNISPPYVCVGRIVPGTALVDLLYQLFEVITYAKVTMREDDALNKEACVWARQHIDRFPVDRRLLKRRAPSPRATPE